MRIDILTLFPEMFEPLKSSILGRALEKELFELNLIDIREFSLDKHKKVDDYVFGGWYKEAECTNVWDFATDEVTGNITLYAQWTAKSLVNYRTTCLPIYEVTLNPDGGTIADNEWGYDNTTGYYTKEALECASKVKDIDIKLWDTAEIIDMVKKIDSSIILEYLGYSKDMVIERAN